jgi:hypothetical protein
MRTEFNEEEKVRLLACGIQPEWDEQHVFPIFTLAAVEAECIKMCKRKWPESKPDLTANYRSNATWRYCVMDDVSHASKYYINLYAPDRPAALVALVEQIAGAT